MYILSVGRLIRIRLKELLQERQLSLRELARRTGTHPEVLSRFSRHATSGVSYELLDRICRELRCQPGDILQHAEDDQINLFPEE